jgi:hypothetical protein
MRCDRANQEGRRKKAMTVQQKTQKVLAQIHTSISGMESDVLVMSCLNWSMVQSVPDTGFYTDCCVLGCDTMQSCR